MIAASKRADLAGPGIGTYEEVERVLPSDYRSLLSPLETQRAIFTLKAYIEEHLCRELHLTMVQVPLIVESESGVNDLLDRDGSRTPVQFHISNDADQHPVNAQVVQAATKWKRLALAEFGMAPGEGLLTDMRAVRKDYFLDHDHSAYVDQWDWELAIRPEDRTREFLRTTVRKIWKVITGAQHHIERIYPALRQPGYPPLPEEIRFVTAEEMLDAYPDLPRKQRETAMLQKYPALFILGIGYPLQDGLPHELRAADYDDWVSEVRTPDGRTSHGLNGDILVYNPVTRRRHELMSGGVRVDAATLRQQLTMAGQLDMIDHPYHRAILEGTVPSSIGGGIGQSRTQMLLLRKAHIGEVSVTVWPKILRTISERKNIHVLS
jgi:aspartate--ammonia ligase